MWQSQVEIEHYSPLHNLTVLLRSKRCSAELPLRAGLIAQGRYMNTDTVAVDYFAWQLFHGLATSMYYTNISRGKFSRVYVTAKISPHH